MYGTEASMLLVTDGARAHQGAVVKTAGNIYLDKLPAASTEPNPIERFFES